MFSPVDYVSSFTRTNVTHNTFTEMVLDRFNKTTPVNVPTNGSLPKAIICTLLSLSGK